MSIQQFEVWVNTGFAWRVVEIVYAISSTQALKDAQTKYLPFGFTPRDIKVTQI